MRTQEIQQGWMWTFLALAVLMALGTGALSQWTAERHAAETRAAARAQAAAAASALDAQLASTGAALVQLAGRDSVRNALARFDATGDYRARVALEAELREALESLPWGGHLALADGQRLIVAATRDERIGQALASAGGLHRLAPDSDVRLAVDNRALVLRAPVPGPVGGTLSYRFPGRALAGLMEPPAGDAQGRRLALETETATGTRRLAWRERAGSETAADWSSQRLPLAGLPLSIRSEIQDLDGFRAVARIESAGNLLCLGLVVAAVLSALVAMLAPYLHGIGLLRRLRPAARAHAQPDAGTTAPAAAGAGATGRPASEVLAYDILATHHVLEEVLREHTTELEKLYRVLHQEHCRRDEAEQALRTSEERFHLAVEGCLEGVWDWGREDGRHIWLAEGFFHLLGLRRDEFPGALQDFMARMHPDDLHALQHGLQQQLRYGDRFELEFRLRNRGGDWHWFATRGQVRRDGARIARVMGSLQDIQARKRAEGEVERLLRQLENRARHDALTGLANRATFLEHVETERSRASRSKAPLSLLMVDIDHFKDFNDRYGHVVGDQVLRSFALVVRGCVRGSDLVARYGGEEFVVLLPETSGPQALELAERIRQAVAAYTVDLPDLGPLSVTCSIGAAEWRADEAPDAWLERADAMLYAAKGSGRNCARLAGAAQAGQTAATG